jgi:hypothetical protein
MPRYFTIMQAERLLPKVEERIREALFIKAEYQRAEEQLRATQKHIMLSGGAVIDQAHVAALKSTRDGAAEKLQAVCDDIQECLLDFPTLYRNEEVYLCWRLGEEKIRFWHQVDTGFRGRKPIDDEFLANHRGE